MTKEITDNSIIERDDFNPQHSIDYLNFALGVGSAVPKHEIARVASLLFRHKKLPWGLWQKLHERGAKGVILGGSSCWSEARPDSKPSDR